MVVRARDGFVHGPGGPHFTSDDDQRLVMATKQIVHGYAGGKWVVVVQRMAYVSLMRVESPGGVFAPHGFQLVFDHIC